MPAFHITMQDDFGRLTRKRIEIESKVLLADYVTLATAFAGHLNAVTDLELVRMDLVIDMGQAFAASGSSNVDVGATFVGSIYGGAGKKASLKVPGFPLAKVDTDGSIDLTDADVANYLDYWEQATPNEMLISDGEEIDTWLAGSLDK